MAQITKPAAVAGQFYPGTANELSTMLQGFFAKAKQPDKVPKAIIAPHAGYIYSGQAAANAYVGLKPIAHQIKRVVLLGPAHHVYVDKLATSGAKFFETPLGRIPLDRERIISFIDEQTLTEINEAFTKEHSLEVHLPFLQSILTNFSIIPVLVGKSDPTEVKAFLEKIWGGPETLIIVSSDLSHYLSYEEANKIDAKTQKAIIECRPEDIKTEQACGRIPINGLLLYIKELGLDMIPIDLCNSGDTAGPKDRVVGYGAFYCV